MAKSNHQAPRRSKVPTELCQECLQQKPRYGFTNLVSQEGKPSESLCSGCYNRRISKRWNIPELDTVEFSPLTLHDSLGKEHTFHFEVRFSTGLGIKAFELINGYPGGYIFSVLEHPETPILKLHSQLVEKIKAGLAIRYIKSSDFEFSQAHLYINGSALNGRIEEREDSTPIVVVDGIEYTWEEFGQCLTNHTGFNFRLECYDGCEEMDISPNPDRPEHLWWLPERPDSDGSHDPESNKTYQ